MKIYSIIIIGLITLGCSKNNSSEITSKNERDKCHELPAFIIEKESTIGDSTIIVNCYLDDNSIHNFMDGNAPVRIVPKMMNEDTKKELYVDKEKLIGFDTVRLSTINQENTILYSVKFPSPKGGTVTISRGIDLKK
jgi:hypothetical protein